MRKPPITEADDFFSHEPDFSFRNNRPEELNLAGPHPTVPTPVVAPAILPDPQEAVLTDVTLVTPTPTEVIQVQLMHEQRQAVTGLGIAAFIISLAGLIAPFFLIPFVVSLLSLILGHVAHHQAKKRNLAGRGFAIAAFTISYITIGATLLVLAVLIIIAVLTGNLVTWLNTNIPTMLHR